MLAESARRCFGSACFLGAQPPNPARRASPPDPLSGSARHKGPRPKRLACGSPFLVWPPLRCLPGGVRPDSLFWFCPPLRCLPGGLRPDSLWFGSLSKAIRPGVRPRSLHWFGRQRCSLGGALFPENPPRWFGRPGVSVRRALPSGTISGDLELLIALGRADGAECQAAGIPQMVGPAAQHLLHLLRHGTKVTVRRALTLGTCWFRTVAPRTWRRSSEACRASSRAGAACAQFWLLAMVNLPSGGSIATAQLRAYRYCTRRGHGCGWRGRCGSRYGGMGRACGFGCGSR